MPLQQRVEVMAGGGGYIPHPCQGQAVYKAPTKQCSPWLIAWPTFGRDEMAGNFEINGLFSCPRQIRIHLFPICCFFISVTHS